MPRCSTLLAVFLALLVPAVALAGPDAGPPPARDSSAAPTTDAAMTGDARAPPPRVKVVRIQDMLLEAIAHYQQSQFEKARGRLQEILRYVGKERTRAAQEAYTYMALVHLAFGETEAAVGAFEKALTINPDLPLPGNSPKIEAAFKQARIRYRAKVRAVDHDPPTLGHAPPGEGKYGKVLIIEASASDASGIKKVVLHFRQAGNRGFSSVNMERRKDRTMVASVPALSVIRPGVEYYIEAWDVLGNGPGLKGSAAKPILVPVKGGPTRPAPPGAKPLYKRWWFWVAVGGAAAATGGIVAAAMLNREQNAKGVIPVPPGLTR